MGKSTTGLRVLCWLHRTLFDKGADLKFTWQLEKRSYLVWIEFSQSSWAINSASVLSESLRHMRWGQLSSIVVVSNFVNHACSCGQPWESFFGSAILVFFSLSTLKLLEAQVSRLDNVSMPSTSGVSGTIRVKLDLTRPKYASKIWVLKLDFLKTNLDSTLNSTRNFRDCRHIGFKVLGFSLKSIWKEPNCPRCHICSW